MRFGFVVLTSFLLAGPVYAQCDKSCGADAPKDSDGCCLTTEPVKKKAADTVAACPAGKERSQYTAGHCCWPSQEWSRKDGRCTGKPACPKGRVARKGDCLCPKGQSVSAFTEGQCCWPNQEWSKQQSQCIGDPHCAKGYEVVEGGCKKIPKGILTMVVTHAQRCIFFVDGKKIRQTALNSTRQEVTLGPHLVTCTREGMEPDTRTVTVSAEGKTVLFRAR